MAQGIEDVAADGIGIDIVFDGDVQQLFDIVEEDCPGKFIGAVGQGLDFFFFLGVFVLDRADQFFQDVFQADEADGAAVFIDDHGQVGPAHAHELEELRCRHDFRDHEDRPLDEVQVAALVDIEVHDVLDVDQSQDVVLIVFTEGVARMPRLADGLQMLVHRIFRIEADDVLAGHHDFLGQAVGEIEDVADEFAFDLVDFPFLVTGRDQHADFIFRMGHIDFVGHIEVAVCQDGPAQPVPEEDEGHEGPAPGLDEAAQGLEALFRALEADGLGNELAKDPEDEAEDDTGADFDEPDEPRMADIRSQQAIEAIEAAESGSAGDETGQGHAELGRPQKDDGLVVEGQERFQRRIAVADEFFQIFPAQLGKGEFTGDADGADGQADEEDEQTLDD